MSDSLTQTKLLDTLTSHASLVTEMKSPATHEPVGLGTDADRARRRRVYANLAKELATRFADDEEPVETADASIVQLVHAQASIVYDLRDAYDADSDSARNEALARANELLSEKFGEGNSLTLAELEALGVVMRDVGFKVLAPYIPIGEVFPCAW